MENEPQKLERSNVSIEELTKMCPRIIAAYMGRSSEVIELLQQREALIDGSAPGNVKFFLLHESLNREVLNKLLQSSDKFLNELNETDRLILMISAANVH